MSDGRKMTSRIPCTPEVHQALKDMATGAEVTFDELLRQLIKDKQVKIEERSSAFQWGLDNRGKIEKDGE